MSVLEVVEYDGRKLEMRERERDLRELASLDFL